MEIKKRSIMKIITPYIAAFLLVLIFNPIQSHADQGTGSILLSVRNQNGDLVPTSSMVLKVYQDNGQVPYLDIESVSSLPYTISSLPIAHQYKVEVYRNSMHASIGYIDLENTKQTLDVTVPNDIGMRFNVFYNDGTTPIEGATVIVKSNDDKLWGHDTTDSRGQTTTFWLSTTTNSTDFYYTTVSLGPYLVYN